MSSAESMGALAIPDPRVQAVPQGWATEVFAPTVDTLGWDDLDDAEARLLGLASYIESLSGDNTELQKALRIVEFRRGVLLDPDVSKGQRTDLSMHGKVKEVAPATASRYRLIARNWDDTVWPHLLAAASAREVSQAAILRLIEGKRGKPIDLSKRGKVRIEPAPQEPEPPIHQEADVPEPEDVAPTLDLVGELERADEEIRQLQQLVDSLQTTDEGREIARWALKYNQLEGRLRQAITEGNEAKKQARYQADILRKIREILRVESNAAIVPALMNKKAA